MHTIILKFF